MDNMCTPDTVLKEANGLKQNDIKSIINMDIDKSIEINQDQEVSIKSSKSKNNLIINFIIDNDEKVNNHNDINKNNLYGENGNNNGENQNQVFITRSTRNKIYIKPDIELTKPIITKLTDSELKLLSDDAFMMNLHSFYNDSNNADRKRFEKLFIILTKQLNIHDFNSIGALENICYMPKWLENLNYIDVVENLRDKYDFHYWRRIRGDGNCYYRAVLIHYLELILNSCIQSNNYNNLIALLKDIYFYQVNEKLYNYKELLKQKELTIVLFTYLIENFIEMKYDQCFYILYRVFNRTEEIGNFLIFWHKNKLADFLRLNSDIEINGIKIIIFHILILFRI